MNREKLEEEINKFSVYIKQTMDLLNDSYRWKMMATDCEDTEMKQKYMSVSDTLFQMFMTEHNNIGRIFKEEA